MTQPVIPASVPEATGAPATGKVGVTSRPVSLRFRMMLLAGLAMLTALGLVGVAVDAANQGSAMAALNARMESYVYLVLAAAEVDDAGAIDLDDALGDPRLSHPGSGIYADLRGPLGHWRSASALGQTLPEPDAMTAGQSQFSQPDMARPFYGYQYGVAWQLESGPVVPLTVSVWFDAAELERNTSAFRRGLWRTLLLAGVILLLGQACMIFFGFRPLRRVAHDVARVELGQAASLQGRYPLELEPLARNVNRLLATEKANQQRYRSALDSLAHSLKTPLAILRAGIERDQPEAQAAMRKAVDDMTYLVTTRLQRAALSARRTMAPPVAVAAVAQRILDSLGRVYAHKTIATTVAIPGTLVFFGEQRDLLEILGNLLDNAFKYGRSRVAIHVGQLQGEPVVAGGGASRGLWIEVQDDGPGIEPEHWSALLQRGVRGDERAEGHGLGLAIVLELVTAYGGQVEVSRAEWGGARVRVEIPAT